MKRGNTGAGAGSTLPGLMRLAAERRKDTFLRRDAEQIEQL